MATMSRAKKIPTLESLMGVKRKVHAQTQAQIEANIRKVFGL